jgi:c-di-GMP-binding flagellar brake protein YcgR
MSFAGENKGDGMDGQDRRRFPRLDIAVDVAWEKVSGKKNMEVNDDSDKTRNISEGGICLIVYEDINIGDELSLDIQLPTQQVIHAVGRVVWRSSFDLAKDSWYRYDVGIEFINISPQDREMIKKFVFSLKK